MASVGDLPKFMTKVNAQKVPWVTTFVVMAAVACFLLLGDIKIVAGMSSLGALLVFVLKNRNRTVLLEYHCPLAKFRYCPFWPFW